MPGVGGQLAELRDEPRRFPLGPPRPTATGDHVPNCWTPLVALAVSRTRGRPTESRSILGYHQRNSMPELGVAYLDDHNRAGHKDDTPSREELSADRARGSSSDVAGAPLRRVGVMTSGGFRTAEGIDSRAPTTNFSVGRA